MSDDEGITAPVSLEITSAREATLTFGPMPLSDLGEMLDVLGTATGYVGFRESLDAAIAQEIAEKESP